MAICRNKQNNCVYEYLGENKFRNMVTGKEGIVDDETARKIFSLNLPATEIIVEYPLVSELIQKCNLKFDNNKNNKK